MANTAQGAKAEADAKSNAGTPDVETSDSGVTVAPTTSDPYEAKKLYHRNGREATAHTLEREIALKFDGYTENKPAKPKN